MTLILPQFRDHLITAGLVRKPSVAGSAAPLWLEPQLGAPAPNESRSGNAVEKGDPALAAFRTAGIAGGPYVAAWRKKPIIEIRYRGTNHAALETLDEAITATIEDRRDFTLGTLPVLECQRWREFQRIGSDEQGFEFLGAWWFETIR